jgi:2-methylisocitrate lyase-like PEP mutase family enzyme
VRVAVCAEAVAGLPFPFTFTARAEGLLRKTGTLDEVIERLLAFEKAGADVLYAPGLKSLEEVKLVMTAVSRPVNVLAPFMPGVSLDDYADLDVTRISVGSALARKIQAATLQAAREMFDSGRFE